MKLFSYLPIIVFLLLGALPGSALVESDKFEAPSAAQKLSAFDILIASSEGSQQTNPVIINGEPFIVNGEEVTIDEGGTIRHGGFTFRTELRCPAGENHMLSGCMGFDSAPEDGDYDVCCDSCSTWFQRIRKFCHMQR